MADRVELSIGQQIDHRYTVTKTLGEGAFGKVFMVSDNDGQVYALKLLKLWEVHPEIRDQLMARFDMEYQTGRIGSPYLVHSHGHGVLAGNPYILMEFCPNGDLTGLPRNADWVRIGQQILFGLKALHACGKVHRDLKPENVLIKRDGTAALTDFGISGDRNKRMTERNLLGKPKQIFGTYAYMPPEQVQPRRGDATVLPTTDIFSFGVMMYQLLTGSLPFGPLNTENELVLYLKNGKEGCWNRQSLQFAPYGRIYQPVIEGCLQPDFKQRLQSVDEVLRLFPAISAASQSADIAIPQPPSRISGYKLRVMQGEEYGREYDLTALMLRKCADLTMGRLDFSVNNDIPLVEQQSCYISRKHCTLRYNATDGVWSICDGQHDPFSSAAGSFLWTRSTNGTYVNSHEVQQTGYYLQPGDIISVGDTKLRFEAY